MFNQQNQIKALKEHFEFCEDFERNYRSKQYGRRSDAGMGISTRNRATTNRRRDKNKELIEQYENFKFNLFTSFQGQRKFFANHSLFKEKTKVLIMSKLTIKIYRDLSESIDDKIIVDALKLFFDKHNIKMFRDLTNFHKQKNQIIKGDVK